MGEWYYARNNQRFGPVSMEQLKQLAASNQLSPTDLVWKDGMANWAAAGSIQGLFAAAAPPPAPVRAPAPAPAPAPVLAPVSGVNPEELVSLPLGPRGPSIVDVATQIATRAVAADLATLPVSEDEKKELDKAGVGGDTAQRYLVWRRSVLWVAVVPLTFAGISLVIDSAVYTFKLLSGFGVLMEVLRILTLLGLPAAAALGALTWTKPQTSPRIVTLAFLACFGLPIVMYLLPPSWLLDLDTHGGGHVKGLDVLVGIAAKFVPMMIALFVSVMSIPPGLVRGSLRVRMLLPESPVAGLPVVALSLMSALFFFAVLQGDPRFGTPVLGMIFTALMTLAPVCYVVAAKTFLRPITSSADRGNVALWQWIYYGLCGGAFLIAAIQLLSTEEKGVYGVWIAILLFIDFIGRSLFVTVVAAQFVLSLSRSAMISQQQVAKTEYGPALDRRLGELETIVGK